jgi:hypothetical protein
MSKVSYRFQRITASAARTHRLLLVALATTVLGTKVAVLLGAELVDSGWAIAVPAPLATGQPADVQQQMILRHLLDGTQLLLKPSPSSPAHTIRPASQVDIPRVAVRPDDVEGWRPAGRSIEAGPATTTKDEKQSAAAPVETAPSNTAPALAPPALASAQSAGPSLGTPVSATPQTATRERECEAENDCGGALAATAAAKLSRKSAPGPALADAYGNVAETAESEKSKDSSSANANSATTEATPPDAKRAPETTSEPVKDEKNEAATLNSAASQEAAAKSSDNRDSAEQEQESRDENASPESSSKDKSSAAASQPAQPVPVEVAPPPPLTRQLLALRMRVRGVLKGYYRKQLNSTDNDPWEVMHGMLAYGVNSRIRQGGPNGNPITSVGWLCFNKPCKGQAMLYVNPEGELRAKYGVGLQGHLGQLLAMLAQCRVSADYPIQVGKDKFTIRDLIEAEKKTCYPKSELTFKLLALQYYIDLNDKWMNDQGLEWDFPRLLSEEMAQPVRTAACGGTHRLSALSLTVKARIRRGEPVDGEYAEAADFVKKYQQYAFRLQNKDGSLSTQWFKGPGDEDDDDRRIKTTGHILEWLCYSLSDEELRDQRTIRAVSYLANLMYSNYDHEWEVGPRSHATHALLLYDERVFQPFDKEGTIAFYLPQANVAKTNQTNGKKR